MRPKKRFGQHFLTSQSAISRIISLSGVKKGVELTVIEFDSDMVEHITEHYPSVRVIHEDASKSDWAALVPEGERWFCLSNLPYNVGTKIVQNLLIQRHLFHSFTFMLQKEVGLRMLAMENNRKRGSLSSFVQMHAEVRKGFLVPPGAFFPPPKVDSIVIHLRPIAAPLYSPVSLETFEKVNRAIFSHQRKSLRNSLRAVFSNEEVQAVEEETCISFSLRPANISNQQIADLVTIFEKIIGSC